MKTDQEIISLFASKVKKFREAKGVTQHQAFSDTGIHFGRIEQGKRDASLTTIVKVANYLGVSADELVSQS